MTNARILLADIETAPAKAHVWGLFNQNIGLPQILEDPRMMGVGAKWLGDKKVGWASEYHNGRHEMLERCYTLLDQADIVVHYNGNTFDTPWIQGELAREDFPVPSPFKQIDLYRVIKKNMRFISHKLQYVVGALLGDSKLSHAGHKMWVDCLEGDEETKRKAWGQMRRYCKQDVNLLEPLFYEVLPYLPSSINLAIYNGDSGDLSCSKCGKAEFLGPRGTAYTAQRAYPQYYCYPERGGCGGWTRDSKSSYFIQGAGVPR